MSIVTINVPFPQGKRGRVFARSQADCEKGIADLRHTFEDEQDVARWPYLKKLIDSGHVVARVHPSIGDLSDVMQIYLYAPDDTTEQSAFFACAMASYARVEKELNVNTALLETTTFQVVDGLYEPLRATDELRILSGLRAWVDRVFPECTPPSFDVKPYDDATLAGWAHAAQADDEVWEGLCDSREDAIREGYDMHNDPRDGGKFYVALARWNKVDQYIDADSVIDNLLTQTQDNHGDFAYEAVESNLTNVARAELDALLLGWTRKYLPRLFWTIEGKPEEIRREDLRANLKQQTDP